MCKVCVLCVKIFTDTPMNEENYPPVNVLTVFRGFPSDHLAYHITPYRFETQKGDVHKVEHIRQMHRQKVGKGEHYHYVIMSREQRYFHLVFDTNTMIWRLVQEVDEMLFFNE
jgi:hypothetical protein